MATKEQIYAIVGAYGLGRVLPAGSTRAATKAALDQLARAGRVVVPAAARAAPAVGRAGLQLARRNPAIAAGALGYGAYEAGLLDPFLEPVAEAIQEDIVIPIQKSGRKTRSKFNTAVSAGMKAIKGSTYYGKKGVINNAKKAFSAVTKTASKVSQGKKVSKKGATGVIARAVNKVSRFNPLGRK
jgi:hypothetical protein